MFKKFTKIEHLARFESSEACASYEFLKWNVIFADNGRGKSTITAIFRSVGENEPHHLLARQTLGQANTPKVSMLFEPTGGSSANIANFNGTQWDKNPCQVLVFDQDFIDNNVHFGGKVEYAQKLGLYEVFVGKQTGDLVSKIAAEDDKIRLLNPQISLMQTKINAQIKSDLNIKEFIALPVDENIEQKVATLHKQLTTLQNKTSILKAPTLQKLSYTAPDLAKLDDILKTSIKTVSQEASEAVKNHIAHLEDSDAESWIEHGHQLAKHSSGNCPYCAQPLDSSQLTDKYSEYFNAEYSKAIAELHAFRSQTLDSLNLTSLIALGRLVAENETRIKYWVDLSVEGIKDATFEVDALQTVLTELSSQLQETLDRKVQDPLTAVAQPQELGESVDRLKARMKELDAYNAAVEASNEAIDVFKAELMKTDDTITVTKQLNAAKDQRIRHSTSVVKDIKEYQELLKSKKGAEGQKAQLRKQLDSASDALIEQHQDAINDCLRKSGASFTLQRIERDHVGGRPNSTFVLEINGEEVNADASAQNAPNLKTALSAGDKTTLAFAFFVSHVVADANLSGTVLVIDDPISSLDASRRSNTLNTIFDLFNRAGQGILLSHDPDFLHGIWQKMGIASGDRAAFQIVRTGRASKLAKWDVEKQAENEQKLRVALLQRFVDEGLNGDQRLEDIVKVIRPTLEHVFKAAYPKEFPSADSLGNFVGNVKSSSESYLSNIKAKLPRIEEINDYVTPYSSHDTPSSAPVLNETEVSTFSKEALSIIRL